MSWSYTDSVFLFISSVIVAWFCWRYFWFFRDPERIIPEGRNIVSPADGTVVYVKRVKKGKTPISVKKGRRIQLDELTKTKLSGSNYYLIGIFMNPFDVHVNRTPISGVVKDVHYYSGSNLPMNNFALKLYAGIISLKDAGHIIENERNTILIEGHIPVAVVQIADHYIRKIDCFVRRGWSVVKGDRIGMIRMGSQVDLVFPLRKNIRVKVKEGDKVAAGSSVIAEY